MKESLKVKHDEEMKQKKQMQDDAKKEISEFLKKRQIEVEELKQKNQMNDQLIKGNNSNERNMVL